MALRFVPLYLVFFSAVWQAKCQSDLEFPSDFKFGCATSAYQVEGAWNEDGKGYSVWDRITHETPAFIRDRSNGDVACDSYHKIDEDVRVLKELGVNSYRFSLSWTRILPGGYDSNVNELGVKYYNDLIDTLIANNITPIVTIYHWDMPQQISNLGGLANDLFVDYFANYAKTVFGLFGDRVKTWITFNEPNMICHYFNEVLGSVAVAYPNGIIEYACTKNLLNSHAEAYHIYNREFRYSQQGKIGISLNSIWAEPANNNSREDIEAAERRLQFDYGIFVNPLVHFDFPQIVKDRVAERSALENYPTSRLPQLTLLEKLKLKGSYDFLGLNYYTTYLVADIPEPPLNETNFEVDTKVFKSQDPSWESTGTEGMKVTPQGLRSLLKWIKNSYNNPEILITECGYSHTEDIIEDDRRINFFQGHLNSVLEAIHEDEVKVIGFTAWSSMDNFEWNQGYIAKFGFYAVNFTDPDRARTPRKSAEYYRNVTTTRRLQ